jgi:hypothetical protein
MSVIYKPVDWFDGLPPNLFRVGDDGSVWRWWAGNPGYKRYPPRWKPLRTYRRDLKSHSLRVNLVFPSGGTTKVKKVDVATLVCRAFQGPRPFGFVPIRIGSDPLSCAAKDLRWGPSEFNASASVIQSYPGSDNGRAKLAESDVIEMRRLAAAGQTGADIAELFGVSEGCATKVINGTRWRHLPGALPARRGNASGEDNYHHVLDVDAVRVMRRMARRGIVFARIAERFSVSERCVRQAIYGETWADVPDAIPRRRAPTVRLRESDVVDIRALYRAGQSTRVISEKYGRHRDSIRRIVTGKKWKHVSDEATITTQPKESGDGREA